MENRGLLFIPDISGFTKFVSTMEIDHSRSIIQELLEVLMNANETGLEVSEVEGDAILFYRFGEPPPLDELYRQVERMFREFHRRLRSYELRRYCYCKACNAATDLTLKVVTHYGEFGTYTVGSFNKLIGRDVIVVHQLLKNDIDRHEYWLVTPSVAGAAAPPAGLTEWMKWESGSRRTESGEIPFHYTQLGRLKENVDPEPLTKANLSAMRRALSLSRDYDTDIITLFHASGDFRHRGRWMEGVRTVEEVDHLLPRVGMKCMCHMEDGSACVQSVDYSFSPERIEFSEKNEADGDTTHYTLERLGNRRARLTLDLYRKKRFLDMFLPVGGREKDARERYSRSLSNLEGVVKEISLPDASAPS